jgi:hypothetical protein
MTNDTGGAATSARSAVPEPSGPAPVESLAVDGTGARRRSRATAPRHPRSAADADTDPGAAPPASPAPAGPGAPAAGTLAALALAWLAAMLWVAHATISSDVGAVALAIAASTLPSVVSAALVAGAGAGLFALTVLTGGSGTLPAGSGTAGAPAARAIARSGMARFGLTLGAGLATGALAGAAFIAGSGTDPARMALAGTLAAAATVGGSLAGARNGRVVAAVVAAGLAVFAAGVLLGLFKGDVQAFYGAGDDEASQLSAAGWYAATAAVASGLAAGLTAYRVLGGARRNPGLRWPAYLIAGAGPGALLLATELIARTGGGKLLGLVRRISDADRTLQAWAEGSRVNNALVVLFVGAIVAAICLGRTLGPAREPGEVSDGERGAT